MKRRDARRAGRGRDAASASAASRLSDRVPIDALRAARLNPAKAFHMIDSLGTVAPGTLADLVLLDAAVLAGIYGQT